MAPGLVALSIVFYDTEHIGGRAQAELLTVLRICMIMAGITRVVIQPHMKQLMRAVHRGDLDFKLIKPVDAQPLISTWEIEFWKLLEVLVETEGVMSLRGGSQRTTGYRRYHLWVQPHDPVTPLRVPVG